MEKSWGRKSLSSSLSLLFLSRPPSSLPHMLDHSGSFGCSTGEVPSTRTRTRTGKNTKKAKRMMTHTSMCIPHQKCVLYESYLSGTTRKVPKCRSFPVPQQCSLNFLLRSLSCPPNPCIFGKLAKKDFQTCTGHWGGRCLSEEVMDTGRSGR